MTLKALGKFRSPILAILALAGAVVILSEAAGSELSMSEKLRRPLSAHELQILECIRELYGDQNTQEDVFVSDGDEAVIFVKEPDGSMPIMVNLTIMGIWTHGREPACEDIFQELIPPGIDLLSYRKILELKALGTENERISLLSLAARTSRKPRP